jgi:hypothetical protein
MDPFTSHEMIIASETWLGFETKNRMPMAYLMEVQKSDNVSPTTGTILCLESVKFGEYLKADSRAESTLRPGFF